MVEFHEFAMTYLGSFGLAELVPGTASKLLTVANWGEGGGANADWLC